MYLHSIYLHIEWGGEIRSQQVTCFLPAATSSSSSDYYGSRRGSWQRTVEVSGKLFLIYKCTTKYFLACTQQNCDHMHKVQYAHCCLFWESLAMNLFSGLETRMCVSSSH